MTETTATARGRFPMRQLRWIGRLWNRPIASKAGPTFTAWLALTALALGSLWGARTYVNDQETEQARNERADCLLRAEGRQAVRSALFTLYDIIDDESGEPLPVLVRARAALDRDLPMLDVEDC